MKCEMKTGNCEMRTENWELGTAWWRGGGERGGGALRGLLTRQVISGKIRGLKINHMGGKDGQNLSKGGKLAHKVPCFQKL